MVLNTGPTPSQLVQNTLIGGGITTSNISYAGGSASRATFTNGNSTNLGLNNGIVLSTCPANLILNPVSYLMSNNLGLPGDADLDAINNGCQTYDACILEFDFIPMSDTVKFRYVFGSEEYPNYVCSQYNDVFAFFVTGPNPTGGNYNDFNIARIPGTNLPVSVNSVNSGTPGGSYNPSGCTSLSYSNYYVNNIAAGGTNIAFNGFTKPLTAWCKVIPCQTYHIKIAVADGYNGLYDSSVFLEANSFVSDSYLITSSYSNTSSNTATEGCSQGIFSFKLSSPASTPYTINYVLGGSAINGTDYSFVPGSITIPVGQDSAAIIINPLIDGQAEGNETVSITYTSGCTPQTSTINISDYFPMQVSTSNDTAICIGTSTTLLSNVSGGSTPVSYSWSNGASGSNSINVSPTTTTTYIVTVTDNCALSATSDIIVTVHSIALSTTSTDELCGQSNGTASAVATGDCSGGPTFLWNTSPPSTTATINNLAAGNYSVTVSCGVCTATADVIIHNNQSVSVGLGTVNDSHCGQADGSASIYASGGTEPYSYLWSSSPEQTSPFLQNVTHGQYVVSVTDAVGCTGTASVHVGEHPKPTASFISDPSVSVIGNDITFYNFSSNSIQSFWNFDDGIVSNETNPVHSYQTSGVYQVWLIVQDAFNCIDSTSNEVIINEDVTFYVPSAFTPNRDGLNDYFGPEGLGLNNDFFEMSIYDRWGKLQFRSYDINNLWDGSSMQTGNPCPEGSYTWIILLKNFKWDVKLYRHTGVVNLL